MHIECSEIHNSVRYHEYSFLKRMVFTQKCFELKWVKEAMRQGSLVASFEN
jgi:hypothetical protein